MGAEYMDYLIGDRTVVPDAQQQHYTEKIIYLPNSYLPHDSSRAIANDRIHARRSRFAARGFRILLLQQQLQDNAGDLR